MRRVAHVRLDGRVQGVGFRAWTVREAERRNLDGWARNRADGSVEAVFAGDAESVSAMMDACRRGSAYAIVVTLAELPPLPDPGPGFRVLPTER
jgi:acylphosphatase